ncbi:porin family protein [Ferruginibacter sp. SUN106]|uniref:porin family protein n=1 Tax=Ferruginibacter sp. SUN106 TaxID=2978348 RepID=UPI003D361FB2
MKKVLTGMAVLFICANANAQLFYAQGGLNLANITKTNDGHTEKNNMLASFNAGFMGRFGLSKTVDLESGLLLTGHGSKAETYFNGGNDYVKSTFNPLYVELPLNLVVTVPLEKTSGIFFNAGPYIAVGVGGKSKTDSKFGPLTASSSTSIKFSNDDPFTSQQDDAAYDKLKRFDYGLNVGGGFKLEHLLLKVNYGFGLAKINSTESNNTANDKNKYRTLSFSVGIPLGK